MVGGGSKPSAEILKGVWVATSKDGEVVGRGGHGCLYAFRWGMSVRNPRTGFLVWGGEDGIQVGSGWVDLTLSGSSTLQHPPR